MESSLYHIQINVSNAQISLPFYKDVFSYLNYKIIDESPEHIGVSNGTTDFWIIQTEKKQKDTRFHRKAPGLNHLAFKVSSKEEVDLFVKEFLQEKKVKILYNGPKLYPQYKEGYYAVFFEDPERIKIELVYIPEEKEWTGEVIEESLDDNRVLNKIKVLKMEISKDRNPKDRWHIYTVQVSEKEIKFLAKHIKKGTWYMDFKKGKEGVVIFKSKSFTFDYKDKKTYKPIIDYGLSQGIPKKQLDFGKS